MWVYLLSQIRFSPSYSIPMFMRQLTQAHPALLTEIADTPQVNIAQSGDMPHTLNTNGFEFSASSPAMSSVSLLASLLFDSRESTRSPDHYSMHSFSSISSKHTAYDSIFEPERNILMTQPSIQSFVSMTGVVEVTKHITVSNLEGSIENVEPEMVSEKEISEDDCDEVPEVTETYIEESLVDNQLIDHLSVEESSSEKPKNINNLDENPIDDHEFFYTEGSNHIEEQTVAETQIENLVVKKRPDALPLADLENITYLRTRLTSMGVSFTPYGEMVTYGAPENPAEFEQMLRLGPMYEEAWNKTVDPKTPRQVYACDRDPLEARLWPDIRVLKKMLKNEGVRFDGTVLSWFPTDITGRLDKLCEKYRKLHSEWSLIACLLPPTPKKNTNPAESDLFDDNGFMDEFPDYSKHFDNFDVPRPQDDKPVNIGWRFSDDFEDQAAVLALKESEPEPSHPNEKDSGPVSIPKRGKLDDPSRSSFEGGPPPKTPIRALVSEHLGVSSSARLVHGPSPLREIQSSSPLSGDDSAYGDSPRSSLQHLVRGISNVPSVASSKKSEDDSRKMQKKNKKGFRRWVAGVFGRKKEKLGDMRNKKAPKRF